MPPFLMATYGYCDPQLLAHESEVSHWPFSLKLLVSTWEKHPMPVSAARTTEARKNGSTNFI